MSKKLLNKEVHTSNKKVFLLLVTINKKTSKSHKSQKKENIFLNNVSLSNGNIAPK